MWCSPRSGSAARPAGCGTSAGRWTPGSSARRRSAPAASPYALRTLPVALDAARVIADVAPDAWLINFTNPAGLVTEALRTVLGDRVIGICDSPIGLVRRARSAAARRRCRGGDRGADAVIDYVGINHLGWLRSLRRRCRDLLPGLLSDDAALADPSRRAGCSAGRCSGRWAACPTNMPTSTTRQSISSASWHRSRTRGEVVADDQAAFYAAAPARPGAAAELWAADPAPPRGELPGRDPDRREQRDEADLSGGGYEEVALDLIERAADAGGRRR